MKKLIGLIIMLVIVAGCAPSQIEPPPTYSPLPPTSTMTPTTTPTPTATSTSTATPYPTPVLPIGMLTPIPGSSKEISQNSISNLREVALYIGNGLWIESRIPYTIQFLEDGTLTFRHRDDLLRDITCVINKYGQAKCSENVILGTDEKFYNFKIQDHRIDLWRGITESGDPIFSTRWKGYRVTINALDPSRGILFFSTKSVGGNAKLSNSVIKVLENNQSTTIGEWPGSEIEKVVFSTDKKFAVICRRPGGVLYFSKVYRDKIAVIDLSQKSVVYQQPFTCFYVPIALSKDGSKLVSAHAYIAPIEGHTRIKYDLLLMNTIPPVEEKMLDIGCSQFNAITFSPDESLLVVACDDGLLRFFNPNTASEVYRINIFDSSIWGMAFSKDGTLLALASELGYISIWAVPPFDYSPLYQTFPTTSEVKPIDNAQGWGAWAKIPQIPPLKIDSYAWEFASDEDTEGWVAWNQLTPLQLSNGNLITESTGNDPYMGSPMIRANAAALSLIEIRMKVSSGNTAEIYFITNFEGTYDESKVKRFSIIGDGQFHTYTLDMSKKQKWRGAITQIRLDPTVTRAKIEIDYIRLTEP